MSIESKNVSLENKVTTKNEAQGYGDDWQSRPRAKKENFSTLSASSILQVPDRKGFRRHWVIEREIPEFEARDWRPVKGNDNQPIRMVMNTGKYSREIEKPEYGILMELPEQYFQENLKADDEERKALMDRRTPSQRQSAVVDGQAFTAAPAGFESKVERNKPIG